MAADRRLGSAEVRQLDLAVFVRSTSTWYDKQPQRHVGRVLEARCVQLHQDFVCGWGAALIETFLTYPFSKLVVRQQLQGISFGAALHQICSEGLRNVYRGLLPPLLQRTSSRFVMFGMYDEYCKLFRCHDRKRLFLRRGCAAFFAGTTEALLCPFERTQTVLQSPCYQAQFRNAIDVFWKLRVHGLREYYRGFSAIVIRNGCSNVLFFMFRDPLAVFFTRLVVPAGSSPSKPATPVPHMAAHFVTGAFLGAVLSTLFYPVNVIKIQMQASIGGAFPAPLAVLKQLLVKRSFSMLYRGVHLNYTRSMMTWGITNAAYEFLKRNLFPCAHTEQPHPTPSSSSDAGRHAVTTRHQR